ncbi:hypothetical protein [Xenorhabdus hominickii]|uniref:Uncharacterized protein n=1 Tax=Xenorhabdus hominickii TaxID=351679 RepID=A0A1V0M470_XENHO|nr:hypothetical protein [Xenorhabdus hominickii]ARD69650.1 hypothetical protein [Xenorhabdus hominickii]PHM52364.1 hypothetical protein Xhom_04441 [Xenorhabdus hominickii]
MCSNPIPLKQAVYRAGLATSLFKFIFEKARNECSIDLNNLIALVSDINQDVHHALLKHSSKPLALKLLSYIKHTRPISLDQAMHQAGLGTSLFEVILDKTSNTCSPELHDLISVACDINQEIYHSLVAEVYKNAPENDLT